MLWIAAALMFVVACVYLILLVADAKREVRNSPRTDMFICNKHGAIPSEHLMQLDTAGITEEPVQYCPFCFHEKMKAAKNAHRG